MVPKAQALQHAGPEILQHDISRCRELPEAGYAGRILEVDRDRSLVAVDGGKVLAECRTIVLRRQRRPAAHAVSTRWGLNLHDIRAEVRQQRTGEGTGCDLAELENADARQGAAERPWHGYSAAAAVLTPICSSRIKSMKILRA